MLIIDLPIYYLSRGYLLMHSYFIPNVADAARCVLMLTKPPNKPLTKNERFA